MESNLQSPSFRLEGRRALVTGASRGLGFAASLALARAGAAVTLVARNESDLEMATAGLHSESLSADYAALDVTNSAAVRQFVADREPFHILVNNAGMNRPKLLRDTADDDIDTVFDLNVKATFYVTREVAKKMLDGAIQGSIINVTSQMGHVGSPKRSVYCASKHAIEGMSRALAWELGSAGIRVNTLCPTFIETEMTSGMLADAQFASWVLERIALGRLGRMDEIMGPIVFLASDASSLMTGSALMVDGGWTAV